MAKFDYLHSEKIYFPGDEDLLKEQFGYIDKLYDYNATRPNEGEKLTQLLREMLAEVGEASTSSRRCTPTSAGTTCTWARTSTRTST